MAPFQPNNMVKGFLQIFTTCRGSHTTEELMRCREFQFSVVGEFEVGQPRGCGHPGLMQVTSLSQVLFLWWAGKGKLSINTY